MSFPVRATFRASPFPPNTPIHQQRCSIRGCHRIAVHVYFDGLHGPVLSQLCALHDAIYGRHP